MIKNPKGITSNPNLILDWTTSAFICRDHQSEYKSKEAACASCPILSPSSDPKFKNYETITTESNKDRTASKGITEMTSCKMFENIVVPLVMAGIVGKEKEIEVYNHYLKTGNYGT
jgi:hypothetical protein